MIRWFRNLLHSLATPSQPMWASWEGARVFHLIKPDRWRHMRCGAMSPIAESVHLFREQDVSGSRCEKCETLWRAMNLPAAVSLREFVEASRS